MEVYRRAGRGGGLPLGLFLLALLSLLPGGCSWVRETAIRFEGGGEILAEAESALQREEHRAAEESFRRFLSLHPDHSEAPRAKLWLRVLQEVRELRRVREELKELYLRLEKLRSPSP